MCGQKKRNKMIHKTLEINYNFPSKVYEKSKAKLGFRAHYNITSLFFTFDRRTDGQTTLPLHNVPRILCNEWVP